MAEKQPEKRPDPGANAGMTAVATLLAGLAAWGGIGYALDWWLGIPRHFGLLVGMIVGIVASLYLVMKRLG